MKVFSEVSILVLMDAALRHDARVDRDESVSLFQSLF